MEKRLEMHLGVDRRVAQSLEEKGRAEAARLTSAETGEAGQNTLWLDTIKSGRRQ